MESVFDEDDTSPTEYAEQDVHGTWLRHGRWYAEKLDEQFHNCHSKRISIDDGGSYHEMVIFYAKNQE